MGFAILRTQKLKSGHAIRRSMQHAYREQDTPNADPAKTPNNTVVGPSGSSEALSRFNARIATQPKVRTNAVLAIEYLITASPEDMHGKSRKRQDAYFEDARRWLEERHGAENVIAAGIHRDETTPHMYAYVVPIDPKGKLNCRHFLGGADALRQMQTDFADRVGKTHGLSRGLEGSRARHMTIQQYYAGVNAAFQPLPQPKTPTPKPLREKPKKPGILADRETKEKYRLDLDKWQFEKSEHDKQQIKQKQEHAEMQAAALATARRHEAQASEAKVYKARWSEMHDMNAYLSRSARKSKTEAEAMRNTLALFTPEEIEAVQERARAAEATQERQQKQLEALETASRQEAEARQSKKVEQEQERRQEPKRGDDDYSPDF